MGPPTDSRRAKLVNKANVWEIPRAMANRNPEKSPTAFSERCVTR